MVTYAKLLTAVWGADCREEVEYLRTFVRQLRKKIEDESAVSADGCLCGIPGCGCADVPGCDGGVGGGGWAGDDDSVRER